MIGRPKKSCNDISLEQLKGCRGMTRKDAEKHFGCSPPALSRAVARHGVVGIFKPMKKPKLSAAVLLKNDGLSAHAYALKIKRSPANVYNAIRRCGLQKHYGLAIYSASFQGE